MMKIGILLLVVFLSVSVVSQNGGNEAINDVESGDGRLEKVVDFILKIFEITGKDVYEVSEDGPLPAFPGAEGMGAAAVGGRGGTVYIVDTLSDNPSDGLTFREAVEANGSRIVVFNVSGIINLRSKLFINNPYITIAGQTSPGGIALTGKMTAVQTHDVIITHMRFRPGHYNWSDAEQERAFEVNGCGYPSDLPACGGNYSTVISYNIILDHCSFSWAPDSVTDVHSNTQDVTFSWCFVTNPLRDANHTDGKEHALGFFVWGKDGSGSPSNPPASVSLHHSFIGYSQYRIPENNYNSFLDSVNNVAYYWETAYTAQVESATGRATSNIIGTYRKIGNSLYNVTSAEIIEYDTNVLPNIYMYGVIDGQRTSQNDANQWSTQEYFYIDQPLNTSWRRDTPWPTTGYSGLGIPVTNSSMNSTYAEYIVSNAGATKPVRDGVDTLAVQNYVNNGGSFTSGLDVDTLSEVITLINLTNSTASPIDSDRDGMGDSWENSTFGSTARNSSGDYDGDGYTDIEEYLFYLGGYNTTTSNAYPNTTLNSPQNQNITTNTTITFNCSATDDNLLKNITLYGNWSTWHANETKTIIGTSNSTTFTKILPVGNYKWNCLTCDNVSQCDFGDSNYTFVISNSSIVVSWNSSLWNMSETTNFSSVNLSNFSAVFRNSFGRIKFLENVSVARNLDLSGVVVGNGFVYLNSSALSEFNVSANLSIFNLSFSNPYVLRDGVNCTLCSGLNYLNGTLNFTVVGFSNYSASESPTCSDGVQNGGETGVDCGGVCSACVAVEVEVVSSSGGGGGGGSDSVVDAVVDAVAEAIEGVADVLNGSESENKAVEEEVAFSENADKSLVAYWVGGILTMVLVGIGIGFFVWKRRQEINQKVYVSG